MLICRIASRCGDSFHRSPNLETFHCTGHGKYGSLRYAAPQPVPLTRYAIGSGYVLRTCSRNLLWLAFAERQKRGRAVENSPSTHSSKFRGRAIPLAVIALCLLLFPKKKKKKKKKNAPSRNLSLFSPDKIAFFHLSVPLPILWNFFSSRFLLFPFSRPEIKFTSHPSYFNNRLLRIYIYRSENSFRSFLVFFFLFFFFF